MSIRPLFLLLPCLLAAAPASAATLAEALHHWTGVTPDVIGQGEHVTIALPPDSPVPQFTARARAANRAGDPGWQLTDVAIPQPTRLRSGDLMTVRDQQGAGWLGARTVQAQATYAGIAIAHDGETTRLDHATVSVDGTGGPVAIAVDLAGVHLDHPAPGVADLLPSHVTLRGHTTPAGAEALSAMFDGRAGGRAPVTLDQASIDVGPAHFTGSGTVTIVSPNDRRGELLITADHFKQLLQQMPMDGPAARTYPALMILRQLGQKHGDQLTWTVAFAGPQVLVDGIDFGALLGL